MFPPFPETGFRPDVHSTVYRCRASNEAGVILSRFVHVKAGSVVSLLDIQGPLFRIEPPYRFEFSNESGGRLDCAAQGSPTPKIEWLI
ncbi:Down syndrome cell adhesion molecule-like protein Dscam2, partial [Diaphorina citri]|uniref:Down syndrome cell adhesion molecule-like protein Dscam2 n=1 Tax=Diaphorina citri TaxID=121845 RepID=A0A3Q0JEX3_DIACI